MITQHQLLDIGTQAVVACSILHSILPPWDFLADFPRVQKFYKVAIYVIGYIGLNARSTIYQSVSMKNQVAGDPSKTVAPQP